MSNVTLETLTRAEAHRKLLALGMPADVAADYLDSEASLTARLAVSLACPSAWPILEAYRRHCKSKAATDPLDTVPAEERERIRLIAGKERHDVGMQTVAPWAGKVVEEKAIAREVDAYHARTAGPEFQPAIPHHTVSETGGLELNWTFAIHTDGSPTSAAASLEALFAKWAPLLSPYLNGEQLTDLRGDVVRAVDASRPGLTCAECHRSVGRDVAHIDCEAPELGLVSDEHGYRAGSVDSAVATVVRAMGRPGLTEEQALATAGPLSRDIYNRIGLATGNKIGAPEWMRDAIATALLRASRGALAPGDISVSRAILERLAKAAESDSDAREARWAAERILQQAPLAAEPARTDPEAARRLAEARAGLSEEQARKMTRHDPAELRALQAAGIARGEPFSVPLDDLLIAAEEREMAHPDAGKRCSRCGRPAYNCADPCVCDPADVAALLRASHGEHDAKRGAK